MHFLQLNIDLNRLGFTLIRKYAGGCQLASLHTLLDFQHSDIQKMPLLSPLAWVN